MSAELRDLKTGGLPRLGPVSSPDINKCFVCQGVGHWARECTSLPRTYLKNDAPHCYRCEGVGHFARFCPSAEKQWEYRQRRMSLPMDLGASPDWAVPMFMVDQPSPVPSTDLPPFVTQAGSDILLIRPVLGQSQIGQETSLPSSSVDEGEAEQSTGSSFVMVDVYAGTDQ